MTKYSILSNKDNSKTNTFILSDRDDVQETLDKYAVQNICTNHNEDVKFIKSNGFSSQSETA